jgi:hypothetical protein
MEIPQWYFDIRKKWKTALKFAPAINTTTPIYCINSLELKLSHFICWRSLVAKGHVQGIAGLQLS